MPHLSNNDRNQALGMLRAGISTREVAQLFNCHQSNRPVKPTTGATLRQALLEEWNNMPQRVIQNIILSMRRRCVACITARGGHRKY